MSPYRPPIKPVLIRRLPAAPAPAPPRPTEAAPSRLTECLRVDRVAQVLDVSKKRIYQLVQEGRLEVIRLGPRQMRILKGSLEAYIERLKREEAEREP